MKTKLFLWLALMSLSDISWAQTATCQPNMTINPQTQQLCGIDCSTNNSFCSVNYLNYCTFNAQPNTYTCTQPGTTNVMTFYFDQATQLYRSDMTTTNPSPPPQNYPQSWFDPQTGLMCDQADQNSQPSCAQDMRDGSFVWDKSSSPDLLRVEYKFDPQTKLFRDFQIFKKDGTVQKIFVILNGFNQYQFCAKENKSCQVFEFKRDTGTYSRISRALEMPAVPTTGTNRIAVVIYHIGHASPPRISTADIRTYMDSYFIPFIESNSCGHFHITYDIFGPVDISPESVSNMIDTVAILDPLIDFRRYDTVMPILQSEQGPGDAGALRWLGFSSIVSTAEVTKSMGWWPIWDSFIWDHNSHSVNSPIQDTDEIQSYIASFNIRERAAGWECGAVADGRGAIPDGCHTSQRYRDGGESLYPDAYDVMGAPDSPDIGFGAWFRYAMGWSSLYMISNIATEHGVFHLPSLESCSSDYSGIRFQVEPGRDYLLDFSETVNRVEAPWYLNFGISIRRVVDEISGLFNIGTAIIDTTPASKTGEFFSGNQDNSDAMLAIGSLFNTGAGTIILPIRKEGDHMDVYIGPEDSGVGPSVSLTVTPTRVTLYNACTVYPPTQPSIVAFVEATDDTAVDGNPVLNKETELPGGGYLASSLGEGLLVSPVSTWFLNADTDLGVGHHRLRAAAHDLFGHTGTSSLIDVYVDPPPSPILSSTVAPASKTLPQPGSSTSSFVFTTHVDPFVVMSRVELFRINGVAPVIPMGSGVRSGDGISYWTYTWTVDPTTLGRGDFDFYVRAQDACGTVNTSPILRVHVE